MNKKVITAVVAAVGLVGFVKSASALNYANATLNVEVTGTLSMRIVGSDVANLAAIAPGGSSISGTEIVLENDSVGMIETFSLKGFDSGTWILGDTAGSSRYALQGLFNSVAPAGADFTIPADSINSASDKKADATVFAGDQTGMSVNPGEQRKLWFKFDAPTATSSYGARQLTVSIVAGL